MHFNAMHQLTQPLNDQTHQESLEDFANFLMTTSPERLCKYLKTMKESVFQIWIRSTQDLSRLFDLLDPERCRIFCETTQPWMPRFITTPWIFGCLLERLPLNKQAILYESFKQYLPDLIQSDKDYETMIRYFNTEQQLDFNHFFAINKIEKKYSSRIATQLKDALDNNDQGQIKMLMHKLICGGYAHHYTLSYFFASTNISPDELINIISMMEIGWLTKINSALNLGLNASQLVWKGDVKSAIERYVSEVSVTVKPDVGLGWLICK